MPLPRPRSLRKRRTQALGLALLAALGLHGLALRGDGDPLPAPASTPGAAPQRPAVAADPAGPRPAVAADPAGPRPAVASDPAGPRPAVVRAAFGLPELPQRQALATDPSAAPHPPPAPRTPVTPATPPARARAASAAAPASAPVPAAASAAGAVPPSAAASAQPAVAAAATMAASAALPAAPAGPHLRLPPSVHLDYRLERGLLQGEARLDWRLDGTSYQLQLEGRLPLIGTLMSQRSSGRIDAAGLAPLRYTERRLKRSERAVNFERPADEGPGRIRFSASSAEAPLRPGAQDRLSWMVQLAARAAASGALVAGRSIEMDVASAGGEVQAWRFVLQGQAGDGSWYWKRATDHPEATLAEVWTDPRRGHWPRRVRLTEQHGEPVELRLQDGETTPP